MMDRALKERIIGAIVLVLFVVLVVPVFLDGPTNDGEISSQQVPLPGQAGSENQTVVLERDRTEPVPAATTMAPAPEPQRESPPVVQPAETRPEATAVETQPAPVRTAPQAASSTGMWAVQLGSFESQENAEKLAAGLRKEGFAAFLSQLSTGSGELHRVRVGPQKDRASAEAMAVRLQKAGHKGQVVPHP